VILKNELTTLAQQGQDRGTVRNALTSQGNTYRATGFTITTPGTGYVVGDALFTPSTSSEINAIIVVDEVSSGAITGATISKPGDYNTDRSGDINLLGGNGTGAIFNITFASEASSKLSDVITPQPNDRVLVLSDETHAGDSWWWIMADYNGDEVYNWVPLAPNNIVARNFTTNPILSSELSTDAVTTAKIVDANVTTVKLADLAVTNAKLAANAVETAKILDANVTTAKLAADAVTTAKILDANVTLAKLESSV
jgi:hypothetical protein